MAPMKARYGHPNLVARDWRRLAGFYVDPEGNIVELQAWSEGA